MVPLAISALSVLLDKEGSDYIFHSFFEQALMVLTWHLQRTIKSWILFVQKVKDSLVGLDFKKFVAAGIFNLIWLGNCPLFYHKLIALQNWIKHNDHCTWEIGGGIFDGSYGNWIVIEGCELLSAADFVD